MSAPAKPSTPTAPHAPRHRTIRIERWADFIDLVRPGGPFDSWAFRGHASTAWSLECSLARRLRIAGILPEYWPAQEARIIRIFKRKAHQFLDHVPADTDTFQWLAIMQHYGAPTRLLDFTWSPYIAAYFALEDAADDAAVWAVHPGRIWTHNDSLPLSAERGGVSLRLPGVFERRFLTNEHNVVYQGEPGVMNRRLTAQNGTFLVPGRIDLPIEAILADYPDPESVLARFIFSTQAVRADAMRSLYAMNVTSASLFPDLQGLARSLAYELEYHWAVDPTTGKPTPGFADDPDGNLSLNLRVDDSRHDPIGPD